MKRERMSRNERKNFNTKDQMNFSMSYFFLSIAKKEAEKLLKSTYQFQVKQFNNELNEV